MSAAVVRQKARHHRLLGVDLDGTSTVCYFQGALMSKNIVCDAKDSREGGLLSRFVMDAYARVGIGAVHCRR
jgi:hypothetical protein